MVGGFALQAYATYIHNYTLMLIGITVFGIGVNGTMVLLSKLYLVNNILSLSILRK
jgi:hypothetical protein